MPQTLAFDVYGTLIDTHGVIVKLEDFIGENARLFSQTWRDKQLEYSFRRGLMRRYENFPTCTRQALDYTDNLLQTRLLDSQKTALMAAYKTLPAFNDVKAALTELKSVGHRILAFSNGTAEAVNGLLVAADIREDFEGVVSVDDVQSFKPNPDVYAHLLKVTDSTANNTWLISSNPFDVIGATAFGLNSAWVKRTEDTVFDPWGIEPTITISSLSGLVAGIQSVESG